MNKFILKNDDLSVTDHWEACDRFKCPFITLREQGETLVEISFDITHTNIPLELASEKVKELWTTYANFFLLENSHLYLDSFYFFRFSVLKEHGACIANQLFEYLLVLK